MYSSYSSIFKQTENGLFQQALLAYLNFEFCLVTVF